MDGEPMYHRNAVVDEDVGLCLIAQRSKPRLEPSAIRLEMDLGRDLEPILSRRESERSRVLRSARRGLDEVTHSGVALLTTPVGHHRALFGHAAVAEREAEAAVPGLGAVRGDARNAALLHGRQDRHRAIGRVGPHDDEAALVAQGFVGGDRVPRGSSREPSSERDDDLDRPIAPCLVEHVLDREDRRVQAVAEQESRVDVDEVPHPHRLEVLGARSDLAVRSRGRDDDRLLHHLLAARLAAADQLVVLAERHRIDAREDRAARSVAARLLPAAQRGLGPLRPLIAFGRLHPLLTCAGCARIYCTVSTCLLL
jgi:hypothetical protein